MIGNLSKEIQAFVFRPVYIYLLVEWVGQVVCNLSTVQKVDNIPNWIHASYWIHASCTVNNCIYSSD